MACLSQRLCRNKEGKYGKDRELVVENKPENCQGKKQAQEAESGSKEVGRALEGEK